MALLRKWRAHSARALRLPDQRAVFPLKNVTCEKVLDTTRSPTYPRTGANTLTSVLLSATGEDDTRITGSRRIRKQGPRP